MTFDERREAEQLVQQWWPIEHVMPIATQQMFHRYRANAIRGYAAGRESVLHTTRIIPGTEDLHAMLNAERARSAKLAEENDKLRCDAQKLYADYMDRGAAMRETGNIVRSLYEPKIEAECGRLQRLIYRLQAIRTMDSMHDGWQKIKSAIAECEASR